MIFSSSQLAAIQHVDGPMLVLAGPGSGKTAVITHRIRYLTEEAHIEPEKILVITFTKAAAREMELRYAGLIGKSNTKVTFGTFHAIFFRILKLAYNYSTGSIISEDLQYKLIREIIAANHFEVNDENEYISNALNEIGIVKNEQIPLENYYSVNFSEDEFKVIYNSYDKALRRKRLIDFDDMMVYTWELLTARPDILSQWQKKYQYILIDEFQDINMLQYRIIKLLAAPENNIFIVGDDDQSIYGFRGAKPKIMLSFPEDYKDAKKVVLDVNYRSTPEIIEGAGRLIAHNKERFKKDIRPCKPSGRPIEYYTFDKLSDENTKILSILSEAYKNKENLKDYCIITRTNLQPGLLISKLMEYNVPFICSDGMPDIYEHWIAQDIFAYIRIARGSRRREDFLKIINRPNRYIKRDALIHEEVDFDDLFRFYEDKDYMIERLEDFWSQLKMIGSLSPFAAINFIAEGVGYRDYLREYADYRRISFDDLNDIYEEILGCAKGYKTFDEWFDYIDEYKRLLAEKKRETGKNDGVIITTMHKSKGLEYANVIIPDVNEGITPHKKAVLDAAMEEERRMFYVAMTRAKSRLIIMSVKERYSKKLEPSRFIEEVFHIPENED
ncbi:MAG: ATP-dependent helicase [Lachnospiraceae bacterium]|nr:ATP-dependent helicase [Lachnospiraceae bacterium]